MSRTLNALHEFHEVTRLVNHLEEMKSDKKMRAPNVADAQGWQGRDDKRQDWNSMQNRMKQGAAWDPMASEKRPNQGSLASALKRESPGPGEAVQDYHAKKQQSRQTQEKKDQLDRRAETKQRKAKSRAARLKEQGRPADYSRAPGNR